MFEVKRFNDLIQRNLVYQRNQKHKEKVSQVKIILTYSSFFYSLFLLYSFTFILMIL